MMARILIAEDEEALREMCGRALSTAGHEVKTVCDGGEALDVLQREAGRFDLLLPDIRMPVMDGITAAKVIRAAELAERRPRTPILALTANALVHQVEEYLAAGMDGHVAKPIEISKLYDAMSRALSEPAAKAA